MLLLRAILKLLFKERLARWFLQPVKMFLQYYSFLQTKQNVATPLKNQPLRGAREEGLEPGDCTGGRGGGVITPGAADQAQCSGGEEGVQRRGDQKTHGKMELS